MGLSRSERVALCLLSVAIVAGRFVRDRLNRPDEVVLFADSAAVVSSIFASDSGGTEAADRVGAVGGERARAAGGAVGVPLDLNAATEAELVGLPGIGPAKARAIVAWRERNGPFATVADLLDVPGIGPKTAAQIEGLVTVRSTTTLQGGSR